MERAFTEVNGPGEASVEVAPKRVTSVTDGYRSLTDGVDTGDEPSYFYAIFKPSGAKGHLLRSPLAPHPFTAVLLEDITESLKEFAPDIIRHLVSQDIGVTPGLAAKWTDGSRPSEVADRLLKYLERNYQNPTLIAAFTNCLDSYPRLHWILQRKPDVLLRPDPWPLPDRREEVADLAVLRERLRVDKTATSDYDKSKGCAAGTRKTVLDRIDGWIHQSASGSSASTVPASLTSTLWIHGPVGRGKTTVMHTVATQLEEQRRLAGSFFFSLNSNESSTDHRFPPGRALHRLSSRAHAQTRSRSSFAGTGSI